METTRLLYSVNEAAQLFGLSVFTLRKHIRLGSIRVVRLGTRTMLSAEEITRIQTEGLPRLKAQPKAA